jgi:NAD+ kinase
VSSSVPVKRIFVLGTALRAGVKEEAERLMPFLKSHCEVCLFDLSQQQDLKDIQADVALVLGGDGAILRAARQMGYRQTPVLGVNLGKLGFLADLSPEDVRTCFPRVVRGEYRVTRHLMFECVAKIDGQIRTFLGLNEVAIHGGPPFHLIDLDLSIDNEMVTRFTGNGLILSTPIGSTAFNLSAGGPILGQELDAFVITPVCPHTLTSRPVVESGQKTFIIDVRQSRGELFLMIDGQEILPMKVGDQIQVRKAPVQFGLVKVIGHSYYQTLRDKLRWGTAPKYRTE